MSDIADLVRISRAGDAFHYRWAARRCLRLVNQNSSLKLVVIEGSEERKAAGEYVIDVSEYHEFPGKKISRSKTYFQLKHSTKRLDNPFLLSGLKGTIEGFAERYNCLPSNNEAPDLFNFTIITNRPICKKFKKNIIDIANNCSVDKRFLMTIEKYTKLNGSNLMKFCSLLNFEDGEGNYLEQKYSLHAELSELLAGVVDNSQVDTIISLVADRALPDNQGKIVREDILMRLGAATDRDLFPAPQMFEPLGNVIPREQHDELLKTVIEASHPVIIHAEGGVGKSVVCQQLASSLPLGSHGIIYDCFGAGKYRIKSQPRHRYRDALVQISNELASIGLCESLIPRDTDLDDALLRVFFNRVTEAIISLRKQHDDAILVIFFDAADNAEMAAEEFGEPCFASQILKEEPPDGCHLVALCRTERKYLLRPSSYIVDKELFPFSEDETLSHIKERFPNISVDDSLEFHRLTSGNPRVQANALSMGHKTFSEILDGFGPSPITVNDQIESQLESAVTNLKELLPENHQGQIELICLGLANLPPFIPIEVLAAVAEVDEASIKSFVSDLGRPLWLSETAVQFRDEPTETWFRSRFAATKEQISSFIKRIKPLAKIITYVSEAIPSLLLQAEQYEELVRLSLSDELLPEDQLIDARNIRVYRLQFAFKAALKQKRYIDAVKLSMRAGEEVAGDDRQLSLLKKNVDLIAPLQSRQRVQELAFRHILYGAWYGSENVYSASLLSSVPEFKGEARSYLRSAENWLHVYFEERNKNEEAQHKENLEDDEIVELALSHYNLFGEKGLVQFIMSWRPPEIVSRIVSSVIQKMIDAGDFSAIEKIAQEIPSAEPIRYQYFCIAISHELLSVGRSLPSKILRNCLDLLLKDKNKVSKESEDRKEKTSKPNIISFAEACAIKGVSKRKIRQLLRHYTVRIASYHERSGHEHHRRYQYLRSIALDVVLSGKHDINIQSLAPKEFLGKESKRYDSQERSQFKEIIGGMLPWHLARAKVIVGNVDNLNELIKEANRKSLSARSNRYGEYDTLPYEINQVRLDILVFSNNPPKKVIAEFLTELDAKDPKFWLPSLITGLRACHRLKHLKSLQDPIEHYCNHIIDISRDDSPEDKADWYIGLARALLIDNKPDAVVYFDHAIEAVSKFGDEMVERWEAVAAIASRYADGYDNNPEMAYRFIRCAELIGEQVAREKYINRNGAIETCAMMSPQIGFSALSRWRDRDVGWFETQLPVLIMKCAEMGVISPMAAWSFSSFSDCYGDVNLATWCLKNEGEVSNKQNILDAAVHDFRILGSPKNTLQKLKDTANEFSIINKELDNALIYYDSVPVKVIRKNNHQTDSHITGLDDADLDYDIEGLDLSTAEGISGAIEHFDELGYPRNHKEFWGVVYGKISAEEAYYFLKNLADAELGDAYDMESALEYFPKIWRSKASIKKIWPDVIYAISRRFSTRYANYYSFKHFMDKFEDESLYPYAQKGVMDGLSESPEFISANTFFSFAMLSASHLSPKEAKDALDFSLNRFEIHIEERFGDGEWSEWLSPPQSVVMACTGLIWSALGSPRSNIRWEAAHCVRRLVEAGCIKELDALLKWMKTGEVGAFGSESYPFYNLHAKLYLLIALSRAAINTTELLVKHHNVFCCIALDEPPHALIQKYSSDIAVAIENEFPGTFEHKIVEKLRQVGKSQFPVEEIEGRSKPQTTPWHKAGEINTDAELYFSYDFDRYWFEPLGRVFGIPRSEVEELARDLIINEWHIPHNDKFIDDPRNNLWRTRRHERETSHSHGSYPHTDGYRFYISYHAMHTIAAMLLASMPIVHRDSDWEDEKWEYWLHRHSLSRKDGRWLADRRDPPPLERREWLNDARTDNWRWEILSENFLDVSLDSKNNETWLNVYGNWNDCDDSREESVHVSCALVSPETSQSLLNALSTCHDPRDYKLPDYLEDRMEVEQNPFELTGWVVDEYSDLRLDEHDPHAGYITYPTYSIGEEVISKMGLGSDCDQRYWGLIPEKQHPVLECEVWGEKDKNERDGFKRYGRRLRGSLSFLTSLCERFDKELIIEVQISRSLQRFYEKEEDDDVRYPAPYSKVYILSKDGVIRDATSSFKLR